MSTNASRHHALKRTASQSARRCAGTPKSALGFPSVSSSTIAKGPHSLPGNKVTLSATPPGGKPDVSEGTYTVEGSVITATVHQEPLVLTYVNNAYESTSFGFPLRFVKQ